MSLPAALAPWEPMANLAEEARGEMAAVGPLWGTSNAAHLQRVLAAYAPLLADSPKEGVRVTRDHSYGPHTRQRLDVFAPEGKTGAPVVIFVHGGGLVRGNKDIGSGVYDNVLYWFARNGCLGVNIEYRLAPEAAYPSGARDVAGAFAWTQLHAREHGGDSSRIFLIGHSAGATHVASLVLDPGAGPAPEAGLAGMVLLSGRLRADVRPENPNAPGVRAYFGDDASLHEDRSPVTHAHLGKVPTMIAIAEFENPLLDVYGAEFFWRTAAARGRAPRFLRLRHHNHISLVAHFNTGEDFLGREILDFINEGK